jgi:2,4-dienoyl-CoA reductase-like NADH-dependent reductase (Old Yellow Enzyme family)
MPYVAAGMVKEGWCAMIGQGRGAFAYPDSVHDILTSGKMDPKKCCTTCSMCSQIMKDGVACGGCVVRDSAIYAPELKKGRVPVAS